MRAHKTLVESGHVVYKIDDLDDTIALIPFFFNWAITFIKNEHEKVKCRYYIESF